MKKDFLGFLKKEAPDIIGLQEIKIDREAIAKHTFSAQGGPASGWDFPGYKEIWNPAERKGYSGTALLVKDVLKADALPAFAWDDEGRVQVLDLGGFCLANVYFPNANHELSRLEFKIGFNDRLLGEFKKLEKRKPLIVCGDFNVAHQAMDLARPKENEGSPGYTLEERQWMGKFLASGFIDVYRKKYPDKVQYSWWSYRSFARAKNIGWRIDYFCVSRSLAPKVKDAFILDKIQGSDHAPVGIVI